MSFSPLIQELIASLCCLPGVGPKSAQRMALNLLERQRDRAGQLCQILQQALDRVGHCQACRTLSENPKCQICVDRRRDPSVLCVVESPSDVLALEQTSSYRGYYFVLLGHLSPLDGIGPGDIGIPALLKRIDETVKEVILATNPTVEGEATAHYIINSLQERPLKLTRIAQGVPMGGELEYLDGGTLARALAERRITT